MAIFIIALIMVVWFVSYQCGYRAARRRWSGTMFSTIKQIESIHRMTEFKPSGENLQGQTRYVQK